MAEPTLTEIYNQTRAVIGDTEVSGGQIYTDSILLPHVQAATRQLWRSLRNLATPRVQRVFYYCLPANTSVFYPATAGITDFASPANDVGVRRDVTQVSISAATQGATGLTVTTSGAHGLTTGDTVVLEQIVGLKNANVLCTVTVTNSTVFVANGLVTTGTYSSGGKVVTSDNQFYPLTWAPVIPSATTQNTPWLSVAVWTDNRFQFMPSNEVVQLMVPYWSSAAVPASGSDVVGLDDCMDFLAKYAGSMACEAQGATEMSNNLLVQAVGTRFQDGVFGGELLSLCNVLVRSLQLQSPYQRGPRPFRAQMSEPGFYNV